MGENYLQNFSLDFLLIHGDRNPRHNMATTGQIFLVEAVLIIIGLFNNWNKSPRNLLFLIGWLILAPIPTAILDLPHALRSAFMLPPLIIFSSLGLVTILQLRNKLPLILISTFFIIQFIFFVQKLYFLSPNAYSNFWAYPAKLASEIAEKEKSKYKYVILSDKIDNIEYAYPVYGRIKASDIISQNQHKILLNNSLFKKFDNVYIGEISNQEAESFIRSLDGSVLFIGNSHASNYLSNYEIINGRDSTTALILKKKQ